MPFKSGMVALVGRPNVGKSTLMNTFVGEKVAIVSNKPQTTRHRILGVMTTPEDKEKGEDGHQIVFVDTPGLHSPKTKLGESMVRSARDALAGIDALIVMIEAGAVGLKDRQIIAEMARQPVKKALIINKIDAVSREALVELLDTLHDAPYDAVIPVSAKRGDNMDELHALLVSFLPEGPMYFPSDMITDQPERVMCGEIIREKALHVLREEIPHGIGVEMQSIKAVSKTLTEIYATIYVERESHKRIVVGKQGSMLTRIGKDARFEIERLLGKKVMLHLFVKVRTDWRNREGDLRTLGYGKE